MCNFPIDCYLVTDLDTFQRKVVFYDHPKYYRGHYRVEPFKVPCGRCMGCRLQKSREWAVRCVHEAQMHDRNSFLTLTYNDEHLPADGSVHVEHFQLFMKRLRKKLKGVKLQYLHSGEYGEKFERPHYHAILFGWDFPDKVLFGKKGGFNLFVSSVLNDCWQNGYALVGDVSFESAAYVSRYVTKKINGKLADEHYQGRHPEYSTSSKRPAIGRTWFDLYGKSDIYDSGDFVVIGNRKMKPPKYYDKIFDLTNPDEMEYIKFERESRALARQEDFTPERLAQREEVQKARCARLVRSYEQ